MHHVQNQFMRFINSALPFQQIHFNFVLISYDFQLWTR